MDAGIANVTFVTHREYPETTLPMVSPLSPFHVICKALTRVSASASASELQCNCPLLTLLNAALVKVDVSATPHHYCYDIYLLSVIIIVIISILIIFVQLQAFAKTFHILLERLNEEGLNLAKIEVVANRIVKGPQWGNMHDQVSILSASSVKNYAGRLMSTPPLCKSFSDD